MDEKTQAALESMLKKYNDYRLQGLNYAAAVHAVISGSRNKAAVKAFYANEMIKDHSKAYMATVKI